MLDPALQQRYTWNMQPEQPSATPTPQPGPIDGGSQPVVSRPPSHKKAVLIVVIVVALLGIGAAYMFLRSSHKTGSQTPGANASAVSGLPTGAQITAQTLASYNKEDLFWGYFQHAAQQSQVVTTHLQSKYPELGKTGDIQRLKVGFDYKTKKLVAAEESFDALTNKMVDSKIRCYDGKQYDAIIDGTTPKWEITNPGYFCELDNLSWFLSDGMNTGGLSEDQAKKFVSSLRSEKGLVTVNTDTWETHKGKQYIHFSVDLKPVAAAEGYEGVPFLQVAFDDTGLNYQTHPYQPKENFGGGYHLEYWVDPVTQLPSYAELSDTPIYDATGKPEILTGNITLTTRYDFTTASFDAKTSTDVTIDPTW